MPVRSFRVLALATASLGAYATLTAGAPAGGAAEPARASIANAAIASESPAAGSSSRGETYYVDSRSGSDSASGTSAGAAWRTLERASDADLRPGDRLLLRRGRSWRGELEIEESGTRRAPIVVAAYGSGRRPRITGECLDIEGSDIEVRGLHVRGCDWAGITLEGDRNVVRDSLVERNVTGVYVKPEASRSRILHNNLRRNNKMSKVDRAPGGDSGAWGILLRGDRTEVAHNRISGSDAFSYDYRRDGAAIEIYGARNSVIHHNLAVDNNMFSELGHDRTRNNVFAYNTVVSKLRLGGFITTRGSESGYGPVRRTRIYHNSVRLSGAESQGIVCHGGCNRGILRMRNNVIQAKMKAAYADNPFDEDYNLFYGGKVQMPRMGRNSDIANPRFAGRRNLRLRSSSPAIDAGVRLRAAARIARRAGTSSRRAPDLGAHEYGRR